MMMTEGNFRLLEAAVSGLAGRGLTAERVALEAFAIVDACAKEIKLRDQSLYAGPEGDEARAALAARGGGAEVQREGEPASAAPSDYVGEDSIEPGKPYRVDDHRRFRGEPRPGERGGEGGAG
jgi:hypothetical protein